jgi:iron complex outermembrane receptor protein
MMKLMRGILLSGVALWAAGPLQAQVSGEAAVSAQPAVEGNAATPDIAADTTGDVVVTATRRETRLQTTASSVAAVTAAQMQARGITDIQSLASVTPGMSFGTLTGAQAHIAIRGIGSDSLVVGQDPRVAFYQDGVYIGRPTAQLGGMFDLERVEVLKGPQGALYGRNATGGAVNVISKGPTEDLDGFLRASYGNYDAVNLEGAIGGALAPGLSARIATRYEHRDGFGKNIVNGDDIDNKNQVGARVSLRWEATPDLSFLTIADYNREKDHAFGTHFFGQANPAVPVLGLARGGVGLTNSYDIASDTTPQAFIRAWGVTEKIELKSDFATIQSTTSYRNSKARVLNDYDGTSLPIYRATSFEKARQFSQELTASGDIGQFEWLTGALFYDEKEDLSTIGPVSAAATGGAVNDIRQGLQTGGTLKTTAFSPYFELTYHLTDTIAVRGGGRYTHEKKSIDDISQFDFSRPYSPTNPIIQRPGFPRSDSVKYNNFVPSATVEWKASPDVFVYAKYSQGFKSGNYNVSVAQPPFQPEKIKSYEVGVKTNIPQVHGVFNLTGFYYDYTNLQVTIVRGANSIIENAANAKIKGVEALLRIEPLHGLTLEGSGTYLDSSSKDYVSTNPVFAALGPQDLSGNQLTQSPKWSLNGSIQQQFDVANGRMTARVETNYVSKVYFTPFNEQPISQSGYALVNANLRYALPSGWSIEGFVRNVGDKKAVAQSVASSGLWGFPVIGTLIPPRTYGVRVGFDF